MLHDIESIDFQKEEMNTNQASERLVLVTLPVPFPVAHQPGNMKSNRFTQPFCAIPNGKPALGLSLPSLCARSNLLKAAWTSQDVQLVQPIVVRRSCNCGEMFGLLRLCCSFNWTEQNGIQ